MTIQSTSPLTYHTEVLPHLNEKQQRVYDIIQRRSGLDNKRIAQILGWEINSITPRVLELRQKGLIQETEDSRRKVPGQRAVMRWEVVYL